MQDMLDTHTPPTHTPPQPSEFTHETPQQGAVLEDQGMQAPEDVEQALRMEIAQLKARMQENQANQLRAMADLDNQRKRMDREKVEAKKYALEGFLKDLLPVVDALEQGLASAQLSSQSSSQSRPAQTSEDLFKGIELVHKKLVDLMSKHGLTAIESLGKIFDPQLHQAIQQTEQSHVSEPTVDQEFVKGYLLNERLIRPAMVAVAVPVKDYEEKA